MSIYVWITSNWYETFWGKNSKTKLGGLGPKMDNIVSIWKWKGLMKVPDNTKELFYHTK